MQYRRGPRAARPDPGRQPPGAARLREVHQPAWRSPRTASVPLGVQSGNLPDGIDPTSDIVLGISVVNGRGGAPLESLDDGSIRLYQTLTGAQVAFNANTTGGFELGDDRAGRRSQAVHQLHAGDRRVPRQGPERRPDAPTREFQKFTTTFVTGPRPGRGAERRRVRRLRRDHLGSGGRRKLHLDRDVAEQGLPLRDLAFRHHHALGGQPDHRRDHQLEPGGLHPGRQLQHSRRAPRVHRHRLRSREPEHDLGHRQLPDPAVGRQQRPGLLRPRSRRSRSEQAARSRTRTISPYITGLPDRSTITSPTASSSG